MLLSFSKGGDVMSLVEAIKTLGSTGIVLVSGCFVGVVLVYLMLDYMALRDDKLSAALDRNTVAVQNLTEKVSQLDHLRVAQLPNQ